MKLILKRGYDTKVSAAAPYAPEQLRVLSEAGREELAIGGHKINRQKIVTGQAIPSCQIAPAASQG